jgi:hypothetical protein
LDEARQVQSDDAGEPGSVTTSYDEKGRIVCRSIEGGAVVSFSYYGDDAEGTDDVDDGAVG